MRNRGYTKVHTGLYDPMIQLYRISLFFGDSYNVSLFCVLFSFLVLSISTFWLVIECVFLTTYALLMTAKKFILSKIMMSTVKKGLTLFEVMVVVLIMAVLLSMTIGLGNDYVKTMQVKKDKELMVGLINNTSTIARTSNYYKGSKYTHIDMIFATGTVAAVLSTAETFETIAFSKSQLVFSGASFTVRLTPYQMGCEILSDASTGKSLEMLSTINTDRYCFHWDMTVCKLQQLVCD